MLLKKLKNRNNPEKEKRLLYYYARKSPEEEEEADKFEEMLYGQEANKQERSKREEIFGMERS